MAVLLSIMAVDAKVQVPLFSWVRKTSCWLTSSKVAAMADTGTRATNIKTVIKMLKMRARIGSLQT